ncbi:hypothetical protein [Bordetella genomosp. 12]|uniref:Uncharacterized protein n=1 Tax=Bordetella genomosp. 12 TaxID=463035 RepID=A0A261VMW0_9BORD|nr:hypothetical protein [Bordetella genomosp. 12]OZI74543.1 hypothetical protein CAL22_08775 [Bordetella genomosp. 12]
MKDSQIIDLANKVLPGWTRKDNDLAYITFARAILTLASAPVAGEAQKPWGEIREDANGDLAIFTPKHNSKLAIFSPGAAGEFVAGDSLYAAPQASEAVRDADHPVFAFLLGEGPLHGVYFGERAPGAVGKWWWRKYLRAALSAQPGAQKGNSDEA